MRNSSLVPAREPAAYAGPALDQTTSAASWPLMICLLGQFRLLKSGEPLSMRSTGKAQTLLSSLALDRNYSAPRETLLASLWPDTETELASQSLNTLMHSLRKQLGDQLGGAAPVIYLDGYYRLNVEAGIGIDVRWFCAQADAGEQHARSGHELDALACYRSAVRLYRGDLCVANDVQSLVEREHLRARYLSLLARLADHHFDQSEYDQCLAYIGRLLAVDPCREDAHRLAMRCYARRGERTQALRQYQVCETVLLSEFDVAPEPATQHLHEQIRLSPTSV
jgi:DNA-binding SARP family transcriptional activator